MQLHDFTEERTDHNNDEPRVITPISVSEESHDQSHVGNGTASRPATNQDESAQCNMIIMTTKLCIATTSGVLSLLL